MSSFIKNVLITTIIIIGGLYLYNTFGPPLRFSVSSVATTKDTLFTVTGEGKASAIPDQATIRMGMTSSKPTISDAQNEVNATVNNLLSRLGSLGVEKKDIKTENYSVYPQYSQTNKIQGYTVSSDLVVTIRNIDKINSIIDNATQSGLNMVGGIDFGLSDAKQKEVSQEARENAVKIAKEKAESLAKAGGLRLGRIINVEESSNDAIQPIMFKSSEANGAPADTQTHVQPGSTDIVTTISLSYETY
jgi:uncharacterized protein YggE